MRDRTVRHRSKPTVVPCLVLALTLIAGTIAAGSAPPEPVSTFRPPRFEAPSISLTKALSIALSNDPAVYLAEEKAAERMGVLRSASGSFDLGFEVTPAFEHASDPVPFSTARREFGNRLLMRNIAITFQDVADGIQEQLDSGVFTGLSNCVDTTVEFGGRKTSIHCPPEESQLDYQVLLDTAETTGVQDVADDLRESFRRQFETLQVTSSFVAFIGRQLLRTFGVQPRIVQKETLSLGLSFPKVFRSGVTLNPQFTIEGVKENFRGKTLNPTYGGKGTLNAYTTRVGFTLDIPLGKGRGAVSAGAPERAAGYSYESGLESVAFALSQSAQNTLIAYWNLAAAQANQAVLERSAERQAKLVEIGQALADADEIAPAELSYVRARLETTRASVFQARQSVIQARLSLAKTIGLDVGTLADAPLAADELPPSLPPERLDAWREQWDPSSGPARRSDLIAAEKISEAAKILADAAHADLKRETNLSFTFFYSGLDESTKAMDPLNFARGYYDSISSNYTGPSAIIKLDFNLPFRNNVAIGKYVESRALQSQSQIQAWNLKRVISTSYRQVLDDETEKFRAGESTAVDIVLTEENDTSEQIQLVFARLRLATLLAQLRYEMGTLVDYRIQEGKVIVERVRPFGLDDAASGGA